LLFDRKGGCPEGRAKQASKQIEAAWPEWERAKLTVLTVLTGRRQVHRKERERRELQQRVLMAFGSSLAVEGSRVANQFIFGSMFYFRFLGSSRVTDILAPSLCFSSSYTTITTATTGFASKHSMRRFV